MGLQKGLLEKGMSTALASKPLRFRTIRGVPPFYLRFVYALVTRAHLCCFSYSMRSRHYSPEDLLSTRAEWIIISRRFILNP